MIKETSGFKIDQQDLAIERIHYYGQLKQYCPSLHPEISSFEAAEFKRLVDTYMAGGKVSYKDAVFAFSMLVNDEEFLKRFLSHRNC